MLTIPLTEEQRTDIYNQLEAMHIQSETRLVKFTSEYTPSHTFEARIWGFDLSPIPLYAFLLREKEQSSLNAVPITDTRKEDDA